MVLLAFWACSSETEPRLVVAGSSTIQPLAEEWARAFEQAGGARVDVQGGGSGVGVSSARSGLADLGMVSRSLNADEADLTPTLVARDGIAVIVHATNPLSGVTTAELAEIYSGAARSWSRFGGADRPITAVTKEEGRSTLELFEKHVGLKGKFRSDLVVIGPNGQAIATVAQDPDAIAYVSIGSAAVAEQAGSPIRRVPLDGVEATVDHVRDGTYPLARDLLLVHLGERSPLAERFVGFALSPEGRAITVAQEFVPVGGE